MPPTSSVMQPAEKLSFAFTTTLVRSAVLKPCIVTLQRVACRAGRSGTTKRPSASVVAVRTLPWVRLVSVTVAPGNTPPCESWTVPETDALVVWA